MNLYRSALLCGLLLLAAGPVLAADWGTIKGQVGWGPAELPVSKQINVGPNPACLKNGPIFENKFVVDKDSKGVKWVMVWLADANKPRDPKVEIPIHPDLKAIKDKTVSLDQPCCVYEPRILGLRLGQSLVAKNSGAIPHNVKIDGGANNPNLNELIPPGGQVVVQGWNLTGAGPVPVACNLHGWMRSDLRVFNHPYFAVTNDKGEFEIKNAPAGGFKLIIWHPEHGWLAGREGMPITIKAQTNGVTDVGQVKLNPDAK